MTPIQQLMLGAGGAKKVVGIDDVFKTYVYEGSGSSRSINTGLDMTEGGLTWIKNRSGPSSPWFHVLADSARGSSKIIRTNGTNAEYTNTSAITSFNNNGFSLGSAVEVNDNNDNAKYASWSFKKQEKFFTIKQFSGTGSAQSLSHDLGSVPGVVIVKRTDSADNWNVYHRSTGEHKALFLNGSGYAEDDPKFWNDSAPTSTTFTVGNDDGVNADGGEYICYLFAGGESTASEAVSVDFDGTGDYLESNTSSDYSFGTGDFTIEGWYKFDSIGNDGLFMQGSGGISDYTGPTVYYYDSGTNNGLAFRAAGSDHATGNYPSIGQWHHIALVRHSGVTKLYLNGTFIKSATDTTNYTNTDIVIGGYYSSSYVMNGQVSNFRVVKGTAVYTSSFRPPTKPLTSISGTALLCCNNSSVTGATTGSVTSAGDPTASTDSPFDDPAGFAFGPNSDQNLIKCGSYVGNGSATGPEIFLNFGEPQWILIKRSNATEGWALFDSMRGIVTGSTDTFFEVNKNDAEDTGNRISLTSTGFKITSSENIVNADGDTYIYIAIAAETGRTINSKNITAGTDVFAMDTGAGSSTIPNFDSGFPVDFAIAKNPGAAADWYTGARLIQGKYIRPNLSNAEGSSASFVFDSNTGWQNDSGWSSSIQSWMWKRHAGFDALCYGPSTGTTAMSIPHNLGQIPEMIWVKVRDDDRSWAVYHKGLNSGTNPEQYWLALDDVSDAELDSAGIWNDTAPSATHFTVGTSYPVNLPANSNRIALLFASVDGISKVGSYTGNGGASITISGLGFSPRLVIVRNTTNATWDWLILDTTRGFASGNDAYIYLNSNAAQATDYNFGQPTSDGFTWSVADGYVNQSNSNYIYYAHA